MAATDNVTHDFQRSDLAKPRPPLNVAAATEIFKGSFVVYDSSGDAIPALATGANVFAGIADVKVNNTGALTTNKPMEFAAIEILKFPVTGAAATNIGDKVFYIDDNALSMTIVPSTGVAGSTVGRLHGFHQDGTPLIDMSKIEF